MRRLLAAVAPLRPFPLVSLLAALLLTAADLALAANGGLLLLAAFFGACALAIGDRVRRIAPDAPARPGKDKEVAAHDGGIAARLGSLKGAGKGGK
jgi:hypothetical protein